MRSSRALLLTLLGAGLVLGLLWVRDGGRENSARAPASAVAADSEAGPRETELRAPESHVSLEAPATRTEVAPGGAGIARDELGADEGVLQVRVVALEDDRPLAGVPVRVETPAGEVVSGVHVLGRRGRTDARTDDMGRVDCAVPAGRELVLHANPEVEAGGASAFFRVRPLEPGCCLTVVIGLVRAHEGDWYGRIVDGATLAPVADARLRLVRAFASAEVRSAPDGRVHVTLASGDGFTLRVEAPGFAPCSCSLDSAHEDRAHEELVRLLRTATLEVEVHDQAGHARPGLEVALSGPAVPAADRVRFATNPAPELRATTDENGRCTFAGLTPRCEASVTAEDGERRVLAAAIRPLESGERRVVALELGPLVELLGTLRDSAGAALGGRLMHLALRVPSWSAAPTESANPSRLARVDFAQALTNADGRFFFGWIPAGEWVVTLVAEPELNVFFEGSADEPTGFAQVEEELSLRSDEERRELELTARPAPATPGPRSTVLRIPGVRVITR